MKGITDYSKDASKTPEPGASKTDTSEPLKTPDEIDEEPKRKKKKRKRKLTDPEVKNVAELLSNNLSLVSPCKTQNNESEVPIKPNNLISNIDNVSDRNETSIKTLVGGIIPKAFSPTTPIKEPSPICNTEETSGKRNAFQFLMNSRNNIIGRNLEGKLCKEGENTSTPKGKSPTLEKRKNLLQKWAEGKGADKRKREDEQVDKCIKIKLEKRTKRLKKMLGVAGEEDPEEEQNNKPKKRGRKPKVKNTLNRKRLSSSESENSNLDPGLTDVASEEVIISEPIKETDNNIAEEPEANKKISPKKNGNLLSFLGIFNKKTDKANADSDCSENSIKVFEEPLTGTKAKKDVIKIKMFTPTNNGKVHLRNSTSVKKDKEEKSNCNDVLNDSLEDFSSPKRRIKKYKVKVKAAPLINPNRDPDSLFSSESSNSIIIDANAQTEEDPFQVNTECNRRSLRKRRAVNYNHCFNLEEMPKADKMKAKCKFESNNESVELLSSDEYSDSSSSTPAAKKPKTNVKIAPVFLKSTAKPKIDPEVLEARRQFLLSSIPDSMKRTIEKQKSELKDFDVFPAISHIQQKCDSKFWNLTKSNFSYKAITEYALLDSQSLKCQDLLNKTAPCKRTFATEVEKVRHLKSILQKIKARNPDYPVYKVFRQIYDKSGKQFLDKVLQTKRKRRSKNARKSLLENEQDKVNLALKDTEMWTEKYKPACSADILGNYRGVKKLKEWLESWKKYSDEISGRKRKRTGSNSESEFELTDCDSRDSSRLLGNTTILHGPSGSGKTSAIYAIANELGFNVLELNASTKRSGKKLLQELHEATQSHQVRKSDSLAKLVTKDPAQNQQHKKMCILLLEDIDIIFEQDDGFLSSLSQLLLTSKRPIILTTTDITPPHVQKFMYQYDCIDFMPLPVQCLAVWLQIVCLVEGILADKGDLGTLLAYNRGDIRKTLLEVQFWCRSGGQLEKDTKFRFKTVNILSEVKVADDELNLEMSEDEAAHDQFVHKNSLSSFEVFQSDNIPERFDMGLLWWNIPDLLGVPARSDHRLSRQITDQDVTLTNKEEYNGNLKLVSRIYDSLALTDVLFKHNLDKYCSKEPVINNWNSEVLNSLELTGRREDRTTSELSQDLCYNLVNGTLESYRKISERGCLINMAVPDIKERRWRANQHSSEEFLKEAVPLSNILDRGSVAMDFLPVLRDIGRFEEKRAAANTKRGNRFRHYLKDLNVNFESELCRLACEQFNFLETSTDNFNNY